MKASPTPSPWRSRSPRAARLTLVRQQLNKAHNGVRAIGERGNSLLKMTFKALRNVSLDPWRIGKIVAAALVILHVDHTGTTRQGSVQ
ncbi:transposase family protein [Nonomuraea sp. H19]|uniref:transposase family protein n=1 Tax=Nonomuraea sp. H19 TaxID=3452206 RepID=UPI003F8C399A